MGMLMFELIATTSQIISCILVLALSVREKPHAPLRPWIIGYLVGCASTLPFFYWLFPHRHRGVVSVFQDMQIGKHNLPFRRCHGAATVESPAPINSRLGTLEDIMRIIVYFFFITWFVLGVVWICEGSSRADAPKLYWTCISILITCGLAYGVSFGVVVAALLCRCPLVCCRIGVSEFKWYFNNGCGFIILIRLSLAFNVVSAVEYLLWIVLSSFFCCCTPSTTVTQHTSDTDA